MLDLLLQGGTVLDGSGKLAYRADVGVAGGRIVLDDLDGLAAKRTIDVDGLAVSPGFIDLHAHSDLPLLRDPGHVNAVAQGVTCEVLGQDGLSYAPIDDAILDDLHARIRSWNGPPPDEGFTWRSVRGYLQRLDGQVAINTAYLAPHGTLRMLVMGTQDRPASPDERQAMCQLLDQALTEGAVGLSTGLTYVPAMYADTDELVALCKVVAAHGGYFAPHHRSYGVGALDAYRECIDIARASGAALHLTHAHLSFDVNRGRAPELLALVDAAIADGLDVTLDSYPYLAGSSYLHAFLPSWVQAGTVDELLARLGDPAVRARLQHDVEVVGCDGSHGVPVDWSTVVVSGVADSGYADTVGRTIAELAERDGAPTFDVYCDLLIGDRLGTTCLVFAGNEDNVRAIARHRLHMAGSDGLLVGDRPHPRAYGTFARYLGWAVREEQLVSLEEMVRKMTSAPARRIGLADRGLISQGMAADLVCFDPGTVADRATYTAPREHPVGIPYVFVNGAVVVDEGRATDARAGRALTHQRRTSVSPTG